MFGQFFLLFKQFASKIRKINSCINENENLFCKNATTEKSVYHTS